MRSKILAIVIFFCILTTSRVCKANEEVKDIPEEILRTEIIIEGRSPIDNQPLSASEYAEMQANNQQSPYPPTIDSDLQQKIFLLQLLKMIRTITFF